MKQVDRYIPKAMELIKDKLTADASKLLVPSVYKGYVSSMGASIILSGLVPTLAFYNTVESESSSDKPRRPLLDVIQGVLRPKYDEFGQSSLFEYAIGLQERKERAKLRKLKKDVVQASIAVKLAMRSFKMDDKKN